jgi:hypothetical protein
MTASLIQFYRTERVKFIEALKALFVVLFMAGVPSPSAADTADELVAKLRNLRSWCADYGGPYGTSEAACAEEARVAKIIHDEFNMCYIGIGPQSNWKWQDCENVQQVDAKVSARGNESYSFDGITALLMLPLVEVEGGEIVKEGVSSDGLDRVLFLSCRENGDQKVSFFFRKGSIPAAGGGVLVYDNLDPSLPAAVGSYSGSSDDETEVRVSFDMHGRMPNLIELIYDGRALSFEFHDPDNEDRAMVVDLFGGVSKDISDKLGQLHQICKLLS